MSSSQLSKDLFAAAREDAPSSDVHDRVWGRVAAASAVPAVATIAAKTIAAPLAGKLVAVGTIVGAASVVVLAYAVASVRAEPPAAASNRARNVPAVVANGTAAGARLADPSPRGRAEPNKPIEVAAAPVVSAPVPTARLDEGSALEEEARIVTEARTALVGRDPARALDLARSTRLLKVRALEPEELGLEARALRALGRTDEALAAELLLRARFPGHALSR